MTTSDSSRGGSVPPRITAKGGDTMWITWGTDTAHLLPRLIAGRQRGPVFLSGAPPGPHRLATTDPRTSARRPAGSA